MLQTKNPVTDKGGLILSRKNGECIEIEGGITVQVIESQHNKVRLRIIAPRSTGIMRSEYADKVIRFPKRTTESDPDQVPAA